MAFASRISLLPGASGVCAAFIAALFVTCSAAQEMASDRPGATYAPAEESAPAKPAAKPAPKPAAKPASSEAKSAALHTPEKTAAIPLPEKPPAKPAVIGESDRSDPLAGVPLAERAAIRAALLWNTGDEANGDTSLTDAIKAYQKRNKGKVTGILTESERDALLAAAKSREAEFGWHVVVDPVTGIRLGLPAKLVPLAREGKFGTRWSSRHGDIEVETFRIKTAESIAALFEAQKKQPATRRVESSALRGDNFVVSGQQGLKRFSVRGRLRGGELRGYTILFDQMMETIVAPVAAAIASAYAPFPERSAPYADLSRAVEYGTGLVVTADGHIITGRKVAEGCQVIIATGIGSAERVAFDNERGLALLRVYGKHDLPAISLAAAAPTAIRDLTLTGIPDPRTEEGAGNTLAQVKARLIDGIAIELRQPIPLAGFSGAAALDPQNRVLGIIDTASNAVMASAEPAVPPVRLIPAADIRAFLSRHQVASLPSSQNAMRDIRADATSAIVRLICVRQ
jgi:hypothetical protein